MEAGASIGTIIFFPLELISGILVFCLPLEKKNHFIFRMTGLSIVGLLVIYFTTTSGVGYASDTDTNLFWSLFGCGLIFFFTVMLVWSCCRITLKEAIYCGTCAYLTEHIAYCIRGILGSLFGEKFSVSGTVPYFIIYILVYVTAYFIFSKRMVRDKHYVTSALNSLGLMLCALFIVLVMSILASTYHFEKIHFIYAMFSCFFVLFSQIKQQNQIALQEKLTIQQQLWIKHKAQYEMSRENIDLINQKCHDLKHQISALKKIKDLEQQKKAISSIEDSVMIYDSILETGNEILDTVLTEKSMICNSNHITMTCIADGKLLDFMDSIDLYTLFGNAMDNAIESVLKLENEEMRFINVQIYEKVDLIFIQLENRYAGEVEMNDGLPVSQKEDNGYHGFGLKSIQQMAEKYHGFITIETENQIFLLRITIPKNNV